MPKIKLLSMIPILRVAEQSSLEGKSAAIGAFNVNFYSQARGILEGLKRADSPGIIQASKGANEFQGGPNKIQEMVLQALEDANHDLPTALHLDHGDEEQAKACIESGFNSVMIDASHLDLEENIRLTNKIVKIAHAQGISIEGEFGKLAGVEEDIVHETTTYADPYLVPYFFKESGADALAVAYGTSHGPNKGSSTDLEKLAIKIIKLSYNGMKAYGQNENHFLVSHGSSTVPSEIVKEINESGGDIKDAVGIPIHKIKEAIEAGVRKINIDTDLRLSITATFRKYFKDNPGIENTSPDILKPIKTVLDKKLDVIDPRDYLKVIDVEYLRKDPKGTILEEVMHMVQERIANHVEKLVHDFGCSGLANKVEK